MTANGALIFFHCPANTGFAIEPLERTFTRMALALTGDIRRVHLAYPDLGADRPRWASADLDNLVRFDPRDGSRHNQRFISEYVRRHGIDLAFGFDQPVGRPVYRAMRRGGVRKIISYWGAPMSSLNSRLVLALKRLETRLRSKPDHFIFESRAMADAAIHGRGIAPRAVSVVHLGVDAERFRPDSANAGYAHAVFGIPRHRKIVFYSGHMEKRKGVHVLVKAAVELVEARGRRDVHFLFVGNRRGEEAEFSPLFAGTAAQDHITFGGYRDDVPFLLQSSYLGAIASTGWDSFTLSSLEMAASGLPIIVSALQGLKETVEPGVTGYLVEPGDHVALADAIERLLNDRGLRNTMGAKARGRVLRQFTLDRQRDALIELVGNLRAWVVRLPAHFPVRRALRPLVTA